MPRLFIAIPLPSFVKNALAAVQPRPHAGLKLAKPDQLHITLHFIGEANIERLMEAVREVSFEPFELKVIGRGQFNRGAVLWAGVQTNPELQGLHERIGEALVAHHFRIEPRSYRPHVTLARSRPSLPQSLISEYLNGEKLELPIFKVSEFALYSSTSTPQGPAYRIEQSFPAAFQP